MFIQSFMQPAIPYLEFLCLSYHYFISNSFIVITTEHSEKTIKAYQRPNKAIRNMQTHPFSFLPNPGAWRRRRWPGNN